MKLFAGKTRNAHLVGRALSAMTIGHVLPDQSTRTALQTHSHCRSRTQHEHLNLTPDLTTASSSLEITLETRRKLACDSLHLWQRRGRNSTATARGGGAFWRRDPSRNTRRIQRISASSVLDRHPSRSSTQLEVSRPLCRRACLLTARPAPPEDLAPAPARALVGRNRARFVGQRKLSIAADTYSHVMLDRAELDYGSLV